jgi:hypothetical protein|tara:strand:- start:5725 stop:6477 length:753 start_codon:yes stop_codon:yes gene_type:complete
MTTVDCKDLKRAIETVVCKGKWAIGPSIKTSYLGNEIMIWTEGTKLHLANADNTTFIWTSITAANIEAISNVVIDASVAIKYMRNSGSIKISVKDNKFYMDKNTGTTSSFPVLTRHPNADTILRSRKNLSGDIESEDGISISERTTLRSVIKTSSASFSNALKMCEQVGSGIYHINVKDTHLIISSEDNNENYQERITLSEAVSEDAVVEYTGPFHRFLKGNLTIATNTRNPILFKTDDVMILRAPRLRT